MKAVLWSGLLAIVAMLSPASAFVMTHHHGGGGGGGVLQSIVLSGTTFTSGSPTATYIGTLSAALSPATPVFAGTYSLVASGGSCSGGDTTHFQIASDALETLGTPAAGTYTVCVKATQGGSLTTGFTITAGNLINASTVAGCTGSGTAASPWTAACLNAAVTAAVTGDTIFLPAGNWGLSTGGAGPTTINKAVNLVGAGSGNTFDAWGHVNNANGTGCSTLNNTGLGVTCVYSTGTSFVNAPSPGAGFILVGDQNTLQSSCTNNTIAHIFFDGSPVTDGGDQNGLLSIRNCAGPTVLNDIRHLAFNGHTIANCETQINPEESNNFTVTSSMFADPWVTATSSYSGCQILQMTGGNGIGSNYSVSNNVFYQGTLNAITLSNFTYTGNVQFNYTDSLGPSVIDPDFGYAGSGMGGDASIYCPETGILTGQCNGDLTFVNNNNLFYSPGTGMAIGSTVNDPATSGGINDLNYTGNWIITATGAIDSCAWHIYADQGNCVRPVDGTVTAGISGTTLTVSATLSGAIAIGDSLSGTGVTPSTTITAGSGPTYTVTPSQSAGSTTITAYQPSAIGMALNTAVNTSCAESHNGSNGFNITNNTILATTTAELNARGDPNAGIGCKTDGGSPVTYIPINVYGFNATKNYMSSPSNQYLTNANSISPTQSGNFCTPAAGSVTGCATSGFTNSPTASMTLGNLYQVGATYYVPIVSPTFTAQYGAVQWLASTSATTPTSADARWSSNNGSFPNSAANSYVPPAYLSGVHHGDTVYLWVMDSANHISAAASALIP